MHHEPGSREAIALEEVGKTDVSRAVAAGLVATLVVLVLLASVAELLPGARPEGAGPVPWKRAFGLAAAIPVALGVTLDQGVLAGNRSLHRAILDFEDGLEEDSALIALVQPSAQLLLTRWLGAGNEEAYPGKDGWLYFRPDVDALIGPPFLAPEVLWRRERGGDKWSAPPQPDPLPAIAELQGLVEAAGGRLIVIPTPLKPAIHPEMFSRRYAGFTTAVRNPSETAFVAAVETLGVGVFDPAPVLMAARQETGKPQFLETDTHWTPQAVDRVARRLAEYLLDNYGLAPILRYSRREATVENLGDIAAKLRLPAGQSLLQPEEIRIERVYGLDRQLWRPDPEADVLLLGDSFTNVFSAPELGWGTAAGLAEQLSFHLGRPVDRLAVNAGGSHATRGALERADGGAPAALAGKKVVLYQFANRELSGGDWKLFRDPEDS